jgi:hypothetical protein
LFLRYPSALHVDIHSTVFVLLSLRFSFYRISSCPLHFLFFPFHFPLLVLLYVDHRLPYPISLSSPPLFFIFPISLAPLSVVVVFLSRRTRAIPGLINFLRQTKTNLLFRTLKLLHATTNLLSLAIRLVVSYLLSLSPLDLCFNYHCHVIPNFFVELVSSPALSFLLLLTLPMGVCTTTTTITYYITITLFFLSIIRYTISNEFFDSLSSIPLFEHPCRCRSRSFGVRNSFVRFVRIRFDSINQI